MPIRRRNTAVTIAQKLVMVLRLMICRHWRLSLQSHIAQACLGHASLLVNSHQRLWLTQKGWVWVSIHAHYRSYPAYVVSLFASAPTFTITSVYYSTSV